MMDIPDIATKLIPISERHFKHAMKKLKLYRDSLWVNLETFSKQFKEDCEEFEFQEEDIDAVNMQIMLMQDEIEAVDEIISNFQTSIAVALSDEDTTVQ